MILGDPEITNPVTLQYQKDFQASIDYSIANR